MLEEYSDIVFSYGFSDDCNSVFKKTIKFYQRRASKIVSLIASFFISIYTTKWKGFFPHKELRYPPSFCAWIICCASMEFLQTYLTWRQIVINTLMRSINQCVNFCFICIYKQKSTCVWGERNSALTWTVRYKIALGLASLRLYLHEEWEQCVVNRDIKSSTIMMDSNFNAKLGDFGLARLVDHELGSQTIVLAGTMGYLSPECVTTGKASRESDVYSFGVVALEIICGRRPVEPRTEPSKTRLVEWVWSLYGKGQLLEAVDKGLSMEFDQRQMECLMTLGYGVVTLIALTAHQQGK
ncbi:unnamed protein product, partial [Vitis vinifera]